ncbi:MAG: TIGR03986 family CRISPR-associated RAMP protein [Candidatus Promineifilaceae bacterium]
MRDIHPPKHQYPASSRSAKAPYNFVPLPGTVVTVDTLPDHDIYAGLSGHFLVRLTTQSPTYIRGLLTTTEFRYQEEGKDIDGHEITEIVNGKERKKETPFRKLVKNKPDFFNYAGEQQPVIPGSSLRGMLRSLFEVVTYSKVQPVSDAHKFYFRAVAADRIDPLKEPYKAIIGGNAKNVHVGYLEQDSAGWYVRPAKTPQQVDGRLSGDRYLKIRKDAIQNGSVRILIDEYKGLDHPNYKPQYYDVTFDVGPIWYINKKGERKEPISANKIGDSRTQLPYTGTLVATGNMLETSDEPQTSPRMNVYLIPEVSDSKRIKLNDQAVADYVSALTPFQKDQPYSSLMGVLQSGRPIFYVPPKKKGAEVFYFGHTPNFRIPHLIEEDGKKRTTTPLDFVPATLHAEDTLDFAEAVFGFIRSSRYRQQKQLKQGDKRAGYGSRVFVTDARLVGRQSNIFFVQDGNNTLVPKILATPKPTAFQHYLVQPKSEKKHLKHYGSQPMVETVIRGHKFYWHKGQITKADLEPVASDRGIENGVVDENSTQHTQIKPLRPDLTFEFKVYFDNLTEAELGALAWVLALPENHCHKIGMGKPLGMGAVLLHDVELHVEDRQQRYQTLFTKSGWAQPTLSEAPTIDAYKDLFEKYVLSQLKVEVQEFKSLPRIQMLLSMLRWWKRDNNWLETTRYMEIRSGSEKLDEYSERPVLPDPIEVVENGSPVVGELYHPPTQRFEKREGKRLIGTVAYFKRSGAIIPDGKDDKIKVHKRALPTGIETLKEGQRVAFTVIQEESGPQAYDIELISD